MFKFELIICTALTHCRIWKCNLLHNGWTEKSRYDQHAYWTDDYTVRFNFFDVCSVVLGTQRIHSYARDGKANQP
jgi:hypothetical protein